MSYCLICSAEKYCGTAVSNMSIAKSGQCMIENAKVLKKKYEALNDMELIKVLEEHKDTPNRPEFAEANSVYRSRFSKDYE